jgi:hypothetical protein
MAPSAIETVTVPIVAPSAAKQKQFAVGAYKEIASYKVDEIKEKQGKDGREPAKVIPSSANHLPQFANRTPNMCPSTPTTSPPGTLTRNTRP